MVEAAVILLSYLVGTIPTGVLVARRKGVDLHSVGSGNPGASNVARSLGWRLGLVTLAGDLAKGFVAATGARLLLGDPRWVAAAGIAAVLGHLFPVWLRFRGGKGVATSLGVLLALVPLAGLAGAAAYALVVAKTRISSAGSLVGAAVATLSTPLCTRERAFWILAAILLVLVILRHAANLGRLIRGEEPRM